MPEKTGVGFGALAPSVKDGASDLTDALCFVGQSEQENYSASPVLLFRPPKKILTEVKKLLRLKKTKMYLLLFTLVFTTAGYAFLPIEKQQNIISLIDAFTRLVQALKPPLESPDSSCDGDDS